MPLALVTAEPARHDACGEDGLTQIHGFRSPTREHSSRGLAYIGAVQIESDALAQLGYIALGEARIGAGSTGLCAFEARLDALQKRCVHFVRDVRVVVQHLLRHSHVRHLDQKQYREWAGQAARLLEPAALHLCTRPGQPVTAAPPALRRARRGILRIRRPRGSHKPRYSLMKGDTVEIVVDAGDTTRRYEVMATKAGRRVEVTVGRGVVEVTEVTRGGTPVRTARFMASRVLALVEHPAPGPSAPLDGADPGEHGKEES